MQVLLYFFVSGCKKCRRGSYSATKVIINFPVILYLLSEDLAIDLSEIFIIRLEGCFFYLVNL